MSDIEKVVKKYFGNEEVIFDGNVEVSGIKIAKGKAKAALFVKEFDEMKVSLLEEGTRVIIAVPNRDWYMRHPEGRDWEEKNGKYILREWKFDPVSGKLWERVIIPGEYDRENKYRAYTPYELQKALEALNYKVHAVFSNAKSERYDPDVPIIYIYAEKLPEKVEGIQPEEVVLEDITPEEGVSEAPKEERTPKKEISAAAVTAAAVGGAAARKKREEDETMVRSPRARSARGGDVPGIYGLRLKWIDSNKKEHEIEVDKDIIIGRGRGDVLTMVNKMGKKKYTPMMVFDYDKKISRKHLEIFNRDGKWYIRDLGSTNGTALNGNFLPGWKKPSGGNRYPSEEVQLRDGDIITLANTITIQANVYLKERLPSTEEEYEEIKEEAEKSFDVPVGAAAAGAKAAEEVVEEVFEEPREEIVEEEGGIVEDESGELVEEPVREEVQEEPPKTCILKWVDGNLRPHEIEISDDVYIGKRKDNNVVYLKTKDGKVTIPLGIVDLEDEISERHLEIHREGGKWLIKDLGSEKGTIVRGDYLPGWSRGKESEYLELQDDDEILIGKYLITVKIQ